MNEDLQLFKIASEGNPETAISLAAQMHGVDEPLIRAMQAQESDGDQSAVSPKGARGRMQLMPGTAKGLGVNPDDEIENIYGGTKYLSEQLKTFNGNVPLALAAYNAGPGAVEKHKGIPPYKETRGYVSRILGMLGPSEAEASEGPSDEELAKIAGVDLKTLEKGKPKAAISDEELAHIAGLDWQAIQKSRAFVSTGSAKFEGMQSEFMEPFIQMAQEYYASTGQQLKVDDAFRTEAEQAEGHRRKPGLVAPPGHSNHPKGLAMDLNESQANELDQMGLLAKYGFTRPMLGKGKSGKNEPWHIELDPQRAQAEFMSVAGAADLGYGLSPQFTIKDNLDAITTHLSDWAYSAKAGFLNDEASLFYNTLANIPAIFNGLNTLNQNLGGPGGDEADFLNFEKWAREKGQETAAIEKPPVPSLMAPTKDWMAWGEHPGRERPTDLISQTIRGFASAPMQVALFLSGGKIFGPAAGMAATGALMAFDQGFWPTIKGAISGYVAGLGLKAMAPLARAQQMTGLGVFGAVNAWMEGGSREDIAAGFFTMSALGALAEGGSKSARGMIKDAFEQFEPKYQRMLKQGYLWRGNDPITILDVPGRKDTQLVPGTFDETPEQVAYWKTRELRAIEQGKAVHEEYLKAKQEEDARFAKLSDEIGPEAAGRVRHLRDLENRKAMMAGLGEPPTPTIPPKQNVAPGAPGEVSPEMQAGIGDKGDPTFFYSGGPDTSTLVKKAIEGFTNTYKELYGPITDETMLRWEAAKTAWRGEKEWQGVLNYVEERAQRNIIRQEMGEWTYGVKSKAMGSAILEYIDLKRNPEHFDAFLENQPPHIQEAVKLFPEIEKNPRLMELVDRIIAREGSIGQRAMDEGVIGNLIENHQNRIYDKEGKGPGAEDKRRFGTTSRHAKQRVFDTRFQARAGYVDKDGIAVPGKKYKVEDVTANQRILADELTNTIADKQLLKQHKDLFTHKGGEGLSRINHPNFRSWGYYGNINSDPILEEAKAFRKNPKTEEKLRDLLELRGFNPTDTYTEPDTKRANAPDYKPTERVVKDEIDHWIDRLKSDEPIADVLKDLRSEVNALIAKDNAMGAERTGKNYVRQDFVVDNKTGEVLKRGELFAPTEVAKALNRILDIPDLPDSLKKALKYQATAKALQLSYSLFHAQAFLRNLTTNPERFWNFLHPVKYYQDGKVSFEQAVPDAEIVFRNGLEPFKGAADWAELEAGDKTIFGRAMDSWIVSKGVNDLVWKGVEANVDFTFSKLGNAYKTQSAIDYLNYLRRKFPNTPDAERAQAAAKHANHVWGGIGIESPWGKGDAHPITMVAEQILLLARDWTKSNLLLFKDAFGPNMEGKLARQYWMLALSKTFAATALIRTVMSLGDDKSLWERWVADYETNPWEMRWLDINYTPLYQWAKKATGGTPDEFDRYFRTGGHFLDVFKMMFNTTAFIHDKGSIVTRWVQEAVTGEDWRHRVFTSFAEMTGTTGDPDKGPLKGQFTKEGVRGEAGPIQLSQMPSFVAYQARQVLPIPFQNLLGYGQGEIDGFDAVPKAVGARISRRMLRSEAEEAMSEYFRAHASVGTPVEQELKAKKGKLFDILTKEKNPAKFGTELDALRDSGKITEKQHDNATQKATWLLSDPKYGKLSWDFKNIPVSQFGAALKIYKLGTPQEKTVLASLLDDKWNMVSEEIRGKYQQEVDRIIGGIQ